MSRAPFRKPTISVRKTLHVVKNLAMYGGATRCGKTRRDGGPLQPTRFSNGCRGLAAVARPGASAQSCSDQPSSTTSITTSIRLNMLRFSQSNSDQPSSTTSITTSIRLNMLRFSHINSDQRRSAHINSTQLRSTRVNSGQLKPN